MATWLGRMWEVTIYLKALGTSIQYPNYVLPLEAIVVKEHIPPSSLGLSTLYLSRPALLLPPTLPFGS